MMTTKKIRFAFSILLTLLCCACTTGKTAGEPGPVDSANVPATHKADTVHDNAGEKETAPGALEQEALELMKKDEPEFDRFYVQTIYGDVNADGLDDVVMEYGIGEQGAMSHMANEVVLFMNSPKGLLKGQKQDMDFCTEIDRIENGRVLINELEACMLSFPKTTAFHWFQYKNGKLVQEKVEQNPDAVKQD